MSRTIFAPNLHLFRNNLTGSGAKLMQAGIPKLTQSLMSKPALRNEETVYNARLIFAPASLLRGLNHFVGDDLTVRLRNLVLI